MKNWKTILTGVLTLATVGVKIAHDPASTGAQDVATILAGLGLLFAKQHNVTGGTVPQAGGTEPADFAARTAAVNKSTNAQN